LNFIHIIVVVTKANAQSVAQDRRGQALSGLTGEGLHVTEVTHVVGFTDLVDGAFESGVVVSSWRWGINLGAFNGACDECS